jgi:hypothetical protein
MSYIFDFIVFTSGAIVFFILFNIFFAVTPLTYLARLIQKVGRKIGVVRYRMRHNSEYQIIRNQLFDVVERSDRAWATDCHEYIQIAREFGVQFHSKQLSSRVKNRYGYSQPVTIMELPHNEERLNEGGIFDKDMMDYTVENIHRYFKESFVICSKKFLEEDGKHPKSFQSLCEMLKLILISYDENLKREEDRVDLERLVKEQKKKKDTIHEFVDEKEMFIKKNLV